MSIIVLVFFLMTTVYFTCFKRTKGFSYKKIHSLYGYEPRWDFGPPNAKQSALIDQISSQPFTLLGSGKECYAFVSADGEIVVKFFKQKHMRTHYLLNHLPLSKQIQMVRNETLNRHRNRRARLYQSYQLAHERLQDHSGVLYLHLTKTDYLKKPMTLISPQGKKLTLKLDHMEFLVQRRAYPIFDALKESSDKAEGTIDAVLDYLVARNEKGIGDDDINCERNLGILEGKVVQVDVGELYPAVPRKAGKNELIEATLDLKDFLERHQVTLVPYLENAIESRGGNTAP